MGTSRKAEALALLGIARRAGAVVKGTDATRRGLRQREVRLMIVAVDGADGQVRKVVPLARAQEVFWTAFGTRAELGSAVGDGPLTAVGVTGASFAKQLKQLIGRD